MNHEQDVHRRIEAEDEAERAEIATALALLAAALIVVTITTILLLWLGR